MMQDAFVGYDLWSLVFILLAQVQKKIFLKAG